VHSININLKIKNISELCSKEGTELIWSIIVMDSSGTPIYSWTHPRAPRFLSEKYEPTLIAGFINAIIQFGHEVIAQPQRIDFGEVAMGFFSQKIGNKVFWFAILSDTRDPRKATMSFLERFVEKASEVLLEISVVEGFTVTTENIEEKLNRIVISTIKKLTRALPDFRSNDKKAIPLAIPITTLVALYIFVIFNSYLLPIVGAIPDSSLKIIALLGLLLVEYALIGIVSGIVSSRMLAGAISAYVASLSTVILALDNPLNVLILASWFGLWSSFIASLVGKYFDSRKLIAGER